MKSCMWEDKFEDLLHKLGGLRDVEDRLEGYPGCEIQDIFIQMVRLSDETIHTRDWEKLAR